MRSTFGEETVSTMNFRPTYHPHNHEWMPNPKRRPCTVTQGQPLALTFPSHLPFTIPRQSSDHVPAHPTALTWALTLPVALNTAFVSPRTMSVVTTRGESDRGCAAAGTLRHSQDVAMILTVRGLHRHYVIVNDA